MWKFKYSIPWIWVARYILPLPNPIICGRTGFKIIVEFNLVLYIMMTWCHLLLIRRSYCLGMLCILKATQNRAAYIFNNIIFESVLYLAIFCLYCLLFFFQRNLYLLLTPHQHTLCKRRNISLTAC